MEAIQTHHLMKRTIDSNASQDCVRSVASPKPNQVGTVLLYGIPIVSLYIESQERLCLAQISNTLLKQFSYNEIHNRRVALGITCVQCTPVQLEILRRAGAMPVSSRRCGMITRREAERLCKSFLGDNAPPRLPDDFAFSVHHECAWGCRGSFLPSRYNSSRAKCIKCSYCGLFFSPNKFIFHSHRIGPGDKYVQPDAANFNSWRRHMKLSGDPPEEIVHAWEDVKAMFNGGTRKRLITASPNSSSRSEPSPKRIKETAQITPPLIHAAAAAAVASATVNTVNSTSQFPVRPINIHHPVSVPSTNSTQRISNLNPELQLPFSRTFMMDYMWHHTQNKSNPFQFSSYALPWMKRPGSLLFGQQQTLNDSPNTEETSSPGNSVATGLIHLSGCTTSTSHVQSSSSNVSTALNGIDAKVLPTFYNNSAFKPVINHQGRNTFPISVGATTAAATVATSTLTIAPVNDDQRTSSRNSDLLDQSTSVKESLSSDDEMVDIETTEEEQQQQQQQINMKTSSQCFKFKTTTRSPSPISINIKIPPSSPTIEIENSTEIVWDGFLKKEHQTTRNLTNIDENGKLISALVPNVSTINLPHLSPSSSASSIDSIEHQSSSSTNLLCKSPSLVSGLCCNIIDNSTHHSHHHHQHHHHHHHQHQHHHQSMKKTIFIPSSVRPYNNTSLSTPSSSTTTDIRLSSRLAADTGSPAPSSLPPPLPQSISSSVHSPPSPSTPSSNSSMNSGSAAIASSPSSSAAVVAAAAAAAVAIAAFNTQQHHHHQHNHHQQHCSSTINSNSNSNNLLSNSNNSNNCSSSICSSQMLNIAAVTAINNQRLSMVNNSTSATASAAAAAGTSNAGASANTSSTIASVTSSTNNQMNNNNNFNIVNNLSTSGNNMISNSSSNSSSNGSSINTGSNNSSSSCNTNNSSSNNNNSHNNLHNDNILHSNQNLTYAINNHICNSIKNKTDNCINSKHSNYSNNNNTISNNNLISKTLNNDSSNNNSSNNSTNNNNNNSEFWSVTRFSFEPPTEYRLSSFYKHDITKHFHTFRHGETTTQSNGIG